VLTHETDIKSDGKANLNDHENEISNSKERKKKRSAFVPGKQARVGDSKPTQIEETKKLQNNPEANTISDSNIKTEQLTIETMENSNIVNPSPSEIIENSKDVNIELIAEQNSKSEKISVLELSLSKKQDTDINDPIQEVILPINNTEEEKKNEKIVEEKKHEQIVEDEKTKEEESVYIKVLSKFSKELRIFDDRIGELLQSQKKAWYNIKEYTVKIINSRIEIKNKEQEQQSALEKEDFLCAEAINELLENLNNQIDIVKVQIKQENQQQLILCEKIAQEREKKNCSFK